jgi:cytoplasmic iron level regulating protein YaaA (DUF328/UPF0246 family)
MFTILLHSSKTMRAPTGVEGSPPRFVTQARALATYVSSLNAPTIARVMKITPALAEKTLTLMRQWTPNAGMPAVSVFTGDIYSGLQAETFSETDRAYANECLFILSGLYGVLRPLDRTMAYRLEMGYRFPDAPYNHLHHFWGETIARSLPAGRTILNVLSAEYAKAVLPHLKDARIITPKFLTVSPKTGQPTFVTVHAKIARGAFAHWLITNRVDDEARLPLFGELGYSYDATRSTELEPVYVAEAFGGLGLSVRLK